jgi:hypothetical protein
VAVGATADYRLMLRRLQALERSSAIGGRRLVTIIVALTVLAVASLIPVRVTAQQSKSPTPATGPTLGGLDGNLSRRADARKLGTSIAQVRTTAVARALGHVNSGPTTVTLDAHGRDYVRQYSDVEPARTTDGLTLEFDGSRPSGVSRVLSMTTRTIPRNAAAPAMHPVTIPIGDTHGKTDDKAAPGTSDSPAVWGLLIMDLNVMFSSVRSALWKIV